MSPLSVSGTDGARRTSMPTGVGRRNSHYLAIKVGWKHEPFTYWNDGAGDGDRTRDIQLGKLAFYR